ncbi:hypothetical protein [Candidatus Deferrimicrobium sp.]|uniref:hypothetical protein n=1 Tax=Candidatus Deferrimicrobium sp. TaxID=3060586 RepID=UPI0027243506|nr:hypothetical protein [Candidatus Deferrimicrobium sp.]MDO8739421.1 hypothetical protein [Candidatus Deferrimicrobium sp.]
MGNERDIVIKISADGTAAIEGMRQVGDATGKLGSRTTSFLDQAKQNWVAYSAVIYAVLKSVEAAWNLADNAMKIDAQLQMLDRLSVKYQTTGTQIAKSLQTAANGVISMDEAIGLATKGIFSGLDPDQMIRLMGITGAAARANGITVAEAYEKIAQAAETGRSRGLRQMGIIVDLEKAHAAYAARLNTTAKDLSEEEKQVASVNAILEQQGKIMDELGPAQENMRTKVLQLKSAWADLKDQIGGVLVQLGSGAFSVLDRIAGSFGESLAQLDRKGGASGSWAPPPGISSEGRVRGPDWVKLEEEYQKLHAANLAKEGALVHDALAAEMGMAQEYHDTVRKLDDEAFKEEEKLKAAIEELDRGRYAKEGEMAHAALAAEMGMDELYYSTLRKLSDDDFENFKAKLRDKSELEVKYQDERIRLQEGMRAQAIAGMGDVPGGEGITGGLFDLYSLADGTDPFSMQLERARLFWEQMKTLQGQGLATIEEMEAAHANYKVTLDNQTNMMRLQEGYAYLNIMQGVLGAVASFSSGKSREMFLVSRAVAVAMAIVQAHVAAIASYAALAGIPIVGPALGAAAASKALTFGYINAALIAATAIGQASRMGGGASMGSLGGGAGGGGSALTLATAPSTQQAAAPSIVVNVHLVSAVSMVDQSTLDDFGRMIVPSITKAITDGVR